MRLNDRLVAAGIIVTALIPIAAWAFKVQDNTARTATATEYIQRSYDELKSEVSTNRSIGTQNAIQINEHRRRLDDHQRALEIINAAKRSHLE
ncbi:hypothetical protein [Paremcibacter congregatus]|uniref:hypothetical protein n=1 Tax=Paremcibacter congregatus TaxID=2043170 RepID=UPI003A92C7DF